MSEVAPPPPPPPSGPPPAPPVQPPTVTVANPPPALLELPLGARLEAVIAATSPQGQIEIDTAIGRLLLATGFPLPKEGPLTLQLAAKGPVAQLLITAIHGLRPETAVRVLGLAIPSQGVGAGRGPGAQAAVPTVAAPAAINLTVGATLNATVLRPGPPAAAFAVAGAAGAIVPGAATPAATGGPASTAQGTAIPPGGAPVRGLGTPPLSAVGQPATTRLGVSAATGGIPAGGQTPAAFPSGPPSGTQFSVRIVAFQPATAGEAPPPLRPGGPPLAPGHTLTGVVTGRALPSGHPVVQTAAASLIVATRTPLPVGTTVVFEVLGQAAAPSPPQHPGGHAAPPPLADGGWPALEQTLAALEEANPAVAQQLAQAVLPRPGVALGANMLFYLVALAGGDLRAWIGDGPMRILQRLRPDLLAKLGDDFGQISRVADERGPSEWRTFLIPFFNGAEVQPIRLHTRQAGDDEDAEKGRKGTRFVVDIEFSRLGRLQLDGLVYQREKHMDLIVRTENKLPAKIQAGIRDIFADANDVTGIKGGIGFQAAPPNFVEIGRPEAPSGHVGLIV